MLHLRTTEDREVKLHQATIYYIEDFARDHFIKLCGTDHETHDWEESITSVNWAQGGFDLQSREVEKVTFTPERFSFNYKGATISGPLNRERGNLGSRFSLDPSEFEEPEIESKTNDKRS